MCGRYSLHSHPSVVALQFGVGQVPDFAPRYNIAPGTDVLVVRETPAGRVAEFVRWGLIPAWAKDPDIGRRLNNARLETAHQKPSFRAAMRQRRCIIPADGFYEWQAGPRGKQPYFVHPAQGGLFGFAGLYEAWDGPDGPVTTCTILTTEANDHMRRIHDRMPAILVPDAYGQWLALTLKDGSAASRLIAAWPDAETASRPVSTRVNSARNEGEDLISALPG
jgi:putative SOS response-associated peptidase YedK